MLRPCSLIAGAFPPIFSKNPAQSSITSYGFLTNAKIWEKLMIQWPTYCNILIILLQRSSCSWIFSKPAILQILQILQKTSKKSILGSIFSKMLQAAFLLKFITNLSHENLAIFRTPFLRTTTLTCQDDPAFQVFYENLNIK